MSSLWCTPFWGEDSAKQSFLTALAKGSSRSHKAHERHRCDSAALHGPPLIGLLGVKRWSVGHLPGSCTEEHLRDEVKPFRTLTRSWAASSRPSPSRWSSWATTSTARGNLCLFVLATCWDLKVLCWLLKGHAFILKHGVGGNLAISRTSPQLVNPDSGEPQPT